MSTIETRDMLFDVIMNNLHDLEFLEKDIMGQILFGNSFLKISIDKSSVSIYVSIYMYHTKSFSGNISGWQPVIHYDIDSPDIIIIYDPATAKIEYTSFQETSSTLNLHRKEYFFTTQEEKYFQLSTIRDTGVSIENYKRFETNIVQQIKKHKTLIFTDGDKCVTLHHPQKYF